MQSRLQLAGRRARREKFHWFTQNDLFLQGSERKQMQTNKQDTEEFGFSDSAVWMTQKPVQHNLVGLFSCGSAYFSFITSHPALHAFHHFPTFLPLVHLFVLSRYTNPLFVNSSAIFRLLMRMLSLTCVCQGKNTHHLHTVHTHTLHS